MNKKILAVGAATAGLQIATGAGGRGCRPPKPQPMGGFARHESHPRPGSRP